jgi:hypothetical protein
MFSSVSSSNFSLSSPFINIDLKSSILKQLFFEFIIKSVEFFKYSFIFANFSSNFWIIFILFLELHESFDGEFWILDEADCIFRRNMTFSFSITF